MKHFKHIIATALTLFMAFALAVPAWAADPTYTITVPSGDTHEYKIYQVLKGTLSAADSKELGNPEWGADAVANPGDVDEFIASLEGKTEAEVADLVSAKVDTAKAGQGTVKDGEPKSGLAAGYYVLVDVTDPLGKNDTKSLNVVKVVGNVTFNKKWDTTSDDKIIVSDTLGTGDANNVNGKVDNVSIGDTVNYQITAKVPAKASTDYNYFYFIINDTLSEGLTLNADSIEVYHGSVDNDHKLTLTTDYLLKTGNDAAPKSFQVGLVNAKNYAGENIIVKYSATLNDKAKIDQPEKNTSTVQFSNNPNHDYDGAENSGFPATDTTEPLGETPKTETETYTTGLEIQKVDENGNVLKGAEFTITGDSVQIVLVSSETFTEATAEEGGEYYLLKDGTYTKDAPVTEAYMKEAAAGATEGYVEDAEATGDKVVTVGGKKYRPKTAEDTGVPVYILMEPNTDKYQSTETLYKKEITYTQKDTTAEGIEAKAEVGADGVVRFVGLGAGTYTITESKTPSGYNTISPITVKIDFDKAATPKWKKAATDTSEVVYDENDNIFKITIENDKGSTLPETGGIGTTLFYIVGGIMVVAAGAMLITKKRVNE